MWDTLTSIDFGNVRSSTSSARTGTEKPPKMVKIVANRESRRQPDKTGCGPHETPEKAAVAEVLSESISMIASLPTAAWSIRRFLVQLRLCALCSLFINGAQPNASDLDALRDAPSQLRH